MSTTTTIKVGESAKTITLPEGKALTIKPTPGSSGTAGVAYLLDQVLGGTNSKASWPIGTVALAPIGPYEDSQKILINCTAGGIDATVGDAAVSAAQPVRSFTGAVAGLAVPSSPNLIIPQARSRKGTVVFDFADTANWASYSGNTGTNGVTRSADASLTKRSAQSLKCVFGASAPFDGVKKTFTTGQFKVQSGAWFALIYYQDPSTSGVPSATFKLSSDGGATKSLSFSLTNQYFNLGWGIAKFRAGEDGTLEFQSGGTWTSVGGQTWGDLFNYVEITFSSMAGSTIWLDSLIIGSKSKPYWSFCTDSPSSTILDIIAPAMAAYGYVGTFFIDGDPTTVNNFASQGRTLIDKFGWKAGHQGIGHTSYVGRHAQIGADWDAGCANFLAAGLPAPEVFAYPLNASSRLCDEVLAARGVKWRRGSGNPVLHNVGFGAPQNFDGMTRQGTNPHLDDNYNAGPAYLQVANRFKGLVQTGGAQNVFTHNERFGAADALGGNASHFYQILDQAKSLEFSDGLQNIHCSDTRAVLDAEAFW